VLKAEVLEKDAPTHASPAASRTASVTNTPTRCPREPHGPPPVSTPLQSCVHSRVST
jgi:hypothetical protein